MEPINYTGMQVQFNPMDAYMKGKAQGLQSQQIDLAQQQMQQAQQAQQQAQDRQANFRNMLQSYFQNPTIDKLTKLRTMFPEQEAAMKPIVEQMNKQQLQSEQAAATQAISAIKQGDTDTAKKIIDQYIAAGQNSGVDTSHLEQLKQGLQTDPKGTMAYAQWMISNTMTPEQYAKYAEAQAKITETGQSEALFPAKKAQEESKAIQEQGKAAQEAIKAKYIEPKTIQEIQKTGVEIKKLLNDMDVSKMMARIAAMNAATSREGNDIKRQELSLKLQEAQMKLNDTISQKASDAQSAFATSENVLNTIDRALSFPIDVRKSAHGPISSRLPTLSSDTADYEAILDTLGSQAFLAQIAQMKGMGALSDAEGKKLQAGIQNLGLSQSAKQAEQNIKDMKAIMLKARKNLELKYGIKAPEISTKTESSQYSPPSPLIPSGNSKEVMDAADKILGL